MLLISIPAAVLAVASYRQVPYIKALAVIFIAAAVVGGSTFYAFGLVTPKPPAPEEEQQQNNNTAATEQPPANVVNATILAGASAQDNPDYDPDPLTVKKGDGVQWVNKDNTVHSVTSKEKGKFDSSTINAGAKWLLNTAKLDVGEYDYYCIFHAWMKGTLKVAESGGAATGTSNATSSGNATTTPKGASNQSSTGNQSAAANGTSGANGASVTAVSIVVGASVPSNGEFFKPADVKTSVGSMVTWKNDDSSPHTVTSGVVQNSSPKPDNKFDSGILNPGASFPFVFDTAGEYPYYCMLHPYMTGKVTVN
jgi:plastocyanin